MEKGKRERNVEKNVNLGAAAADAGKNAIAFLGRAKGSVVRVLDQNGDGTLNLKDVSEAAGAIGNAAKNNAIAMKESREARKCERERRQFCPLFREDLKRGDFSFSRLLRVTEPDRKRAESEACRGAVGFVSEQKETQIVSLYREYMDSCGLTFHQNAISEFYYMDPSDKNSYIALEEYFDYLKEARINELQEVAQDLGARFFRVTYRDEKKASSGHSCVVSEGMASPTGEGSAEEEHRAFSAEAALVEIAAEMKCPGHAPVAPVLRYLKNEPCIQTLVSLRMKDSPVTHQKYKLRLSNSSGMNTMEAARIDAALKSMKASCGVSVVSEIQNESHRFFEYEVSF